MAILPSDEQITQLLEKNPEGPIHMLNMLKFKEFAQYPDGSDAELSGFEAYMRYGVEVMSLIAELGGEIVFTNPTNALVIGDGDLQWDAVTIVRYPSLLAFLEMTNSPEYEAIHVHRDAGLEHQLLVQC